MTSTSFQAVLAQAIAQAPTAQEAARLWETVPGHAPDVAQVLGLGLRACHSPAIVACAQRLANMGTSLAQHDQASALSGWRRSPTQPWQVAPETEKQLGHLLAELSLVHPDLRIHSGKSGGQEKTHGPISWCADRFLVNAARGLLEGFAQPLAEDMSRALAVCVDRLSSERKNEQEWMGLLEALLARGANPTIPGIGSAFDATSARDRVVFHAPQWSRHPIYLIQRVLCLGEGEFAANQGHGHSMLSCWVQQGGSHEVALHLAQGSTLTPETLLRLCERHIATTRAKDTELFAAVPRCVRLPELASVQVQEMMLELCTATANRGASDYPETILHKAGVLLSRCGPEPEQSQVLAFWNDMLDILREGHAARMETSALHARLEAHAQACAIDHDTPHAHAARSGWRL